MEQLFRLNWGCKYRIPFDRKSMITQIGVIVRFGLGSIPSIDYTKSLNLSPREVTWLDDISDSVVTAQFVTMWQCDSVTHTLFQCLETFNPELRIPIVPFLVFIYSPVLWKHSQKGDSWTWNFWLVSDQTFSVYGQGLPETDAQSENWNILQQQNLLVWKVQRNIDWYMRGNGIALSQFWSHFFSLQN